MSGPGLVVLGLITLIVVLYVLTLQRVLERCKPQNRTMSPHMVWLQMVPVFGLLWHFKNVMAISGSLENEYRSRGVAWQRPHQALGVAMGICLVGGYGLTLLLWRVGLEPAVGGSTVIDMPLTTLRMVGSLMALAGIVTTALYWIRISRASKDLADRAHTVRQVRLPRDHSGHHAV